MGLACWPILALLLSLLTCPAWSLRTKIYQDLADGLSGEYGLNFPTPHFISAVENATLVLHTRGGKQKQLVIALMGSDAILDTELRHILYNLHNISFHNPATNQTHTLAQHTVVGILTAATVARCSAMAGQFKHTCTSLEQKQFSGEAYAFGSNTFFNTGFIRIKLINDILTLGRDVYFLDADQIILQNPLPYLLAREADILISTSCYYHDDFATLTGISPSYNTYNIGIMYLRSSPTVLRCMLNWFQHMQLSARHHEKPWDQHLFSVVVADCHKSFTSDHIKVSVLNAQAFPNLCMGTCGCRHFYDETVNETVGTGANFLLNHATQQSTDLCKAQIVEKWIQFHFPCNTLEHGKAGPREKITYMRGHLAMYQSLVGPVNSMSEALP